MKFLQKIKDWWTLKSLEKAMNKEIDQNVNMWFNRSLEQIAEHDSDAQQKYFNGITLMKRRIKDAAGDLTQAAFMQEFAGKDMLTLATDEDQHRDSC